MKAVQTCEVGTPLALHGIRKSFTVTGLWWLYSLMNLHF